MSTGPTHVLGLPLVVLDDDDPMLAEVPAGSCGMDDAACYVRRSDWPRLVEALAAAIPAHPSPTKLTPTWPFLPPGQEPAEA